MPSTADYAPPTAPPAGWRGNFIGLVVVGIISGTLSTLSGRIPAAIVPATLIALIPGVLYGGLTALVMRFTGMALTRTAALFFVAVIFIWGAAVHVAPVACGDWLRGGGFNCTLAFAGLAGGGIGAAALSIFSAYLIPAFRKSGPIAAMVVIGVATGGLLVFGDFSMFIAWQSGMNLVLGYVLSRSERPRH